MSFKTKQGAFSRFISVLLTLCMVFSAFPLSALAADISDIAEENAWKRMLEIGIVDEDGELIEDTAFTLADGREAYSITEFLDMIDAEDTDPDMAVTVWGNGSVATVQEIVYALSIEYQMKDIASSVRYLSENGAAANENDTADTNDAPQAESLPRLTYEMELYGNMFNVYFRLEDADGNSIIASEDITFDVGLFGDVDGIFEPELEINTAYKFKDLTGVNTYLSRTLEAYDCISSGFDGYFDGVRDVMSYDGHIFGIPYYLTADGFTSENDTIDKLSPDYTLDDFWNFCEESGSSRILFCTTLTNQKPFYYIISSILEDGMRKGDISRDTLLECIETYMKYRKAGSLNLNPPGRFRSRSLLPISAIW